MNTALEQKLRELIDETAQHAAPAAHAVLHLLLGCYYNGTQNKFAEHCCKFSPLEVCSTGIERATDLDDLLFDQGTGTYVH